MLKNRWSVSRKMDGDTFTRFVADETVRPLSKKLSKDSLDSSRFSTTKLPPIPFKNPKMAGELFSFEKAALY